MLPALAVAIPLILSGAVFAASPGPASGPAAGTPTAMPFPDITMAPLITPAPLPGIAAPAWSVGDLPTDGYALGSADAPVTVEVFEDFQCPYCRRFTQEVMPQLIERYVRDGAARVVFRDLPFLGLESQWAAVAGRLAADQGRFWDLYGYLYANQLGENVGSFTPDRLMRIGQAAGLDMDAFIAGLQVPAARETFAAIIADVAPEVRALNVSATPTVIVNGVKLGSPALGDVMAAIDAALAAPSGTPAASGITIASPAP